MQDMPYDRKGPLLPMLGKHLSLALALILDKYLVGFDCQNRSSLYV